MLPWTRKVYCCLSCVAQYFAIRFLQTKLCWLNFTNLVTCWERPGLLVFSSNFLDLFWQYPFTAELLYDQTIIGHLKDFALCTIEWPLNKSYQSKVSNFYLKEHLFVIVISPEWAYTNYSICDTQWVILNAIWLLNWYWLIL